MPGISNFCIIFAAHSTIETHRQIAKTANTLMFPARIACTEGDQAEIQSSSFQMHLEFGILNCRLY